MKKTQKFTNLIQLNAESLGIKSLDNEIVDYLNNEVEEKFDSYEDFKKEAIKNNNSINLSNFGKQSSNYKTRKERIDELNRFKKELLDSKNINNEKDNNSGEQKRK